MDVDLSTHPRALATQFSVINSCYQDQGSLHKITIVVPRSTRTRAWPQISPSAISALGSSHGGYVIGSDCSSELHLCSNADGSSQLAGTNHLHHFC